MGPDEDPGLVWSGMASVGLSGGARSAAADTAAQRLSRRRGLREETETPSQRGGTQKQQQQCNGNIDKQRRSCVNPNPCLDSPGP